MNTPSPRAMANILIAEYPHLNSAEDIFDQAVTANLLAGFDELDTLAVWERLTTIREGMTCVWCHTTGGVLNPLIASLVEFNRTMVECRLCLSLMNAEADE
jgi:hypothetical protein